MSIKSYKLIKDYVSYIESNPIEIEEMFKIIKGKAKILGDRPEYVLYLKFNLEPTTDLNLFAYRIVFSIETCPSNSSNHTYYKLRRTSICVRSGLYVQDNLFDLCKILGFISDPSTFMIHMSEIPCHNMDISELISIIHV